MRKILGVTILFLAMGLLGFLEYKWLNDADVENQEVKMADVMRELASSVNLIEAGFRAIDDVGLEDQVASFRSLLGELLDIPYVVKNEQDTAKELRIYEDGLLDRMAFWEELKSLRAILVSFADRLTGEFGSAKITTELFRKIEEEFGVLGSNLPDVSYEIIQQAEDELTVILGQIVAAAAIAANCINVCPSWVIEEQVVKLEKCFEVATEKVEMINGQIDLRLGSTILLNYFMKPVY